MFAKVNLLIHLIFVIVQESTIAEWVEVPQFSNEAKVYRIPFTKYDRGQKYFLNNRDGPKIYEYGNASVTDENFRRPLNQQHAPDKTTQSTLTFVDTSEIVSTMKNVHWSDTSETIVTKNPQNNENLSEDVFVEDEKEDNVTESTTYVHDKIVIDGDQPYEAAPDGIQTEQQTAKPEVEENTGKTSFLAYIPLELFKKVHAILRSHSTTVEGKINFLKCFEKTLLDQIEKRLVPVLSPVRTKRESRGDHGWDDHDDSAGFPSLEGALMAISFLTFAVYLVQLVMMLFRNMGNNTTPAGAATVLYNRSKRSIDEFTEDTARILGYLDKFAETNQTNNN